MRRLDKSDIYLLKVFIALSPGRGNGDPQSNVVIYLEIIDAAADVQGWKTQPRMTDHERYFNQDLYAYQKSV